MSSRPRSRNWPAVIHQGLLLRRPGQPTPKAHARQALGRVPIWPPPIPKPDQLQDALSRVKQLQGLLPICSYCKRIRDDHDYWQQVETYMSEHSQATFTHGICPECYERFFKTELEELRKSK